QAGHRQAMPRGERWPNECRRRPVVADERRHGQLLVVDLEYDVGGHEPGRRPDPAPAVAATTDLPPTDVARRNPPLEREAAECPPDELPGKPRRVFDSGPGPLLR